MLHDIAGMVLLINPPANSQRQQHAEREGPEPPQNRTNWALIKSYLHANFFYKPNSRFYLSIMSKDFSSDKKY
jgi:hypothetical protein